MQGRYPSASRVHWALALAASLTFASGCEARGGTEPEAVLRAFLTDLRYGRADRAFDALTTASQIELRARHDTLARAAGSTPTFDPAEILYDDLELRALAEPESVVVASPLGSEVMLRVGVRGGRSASIHLVRTGSTWKVDLMRSLHPPPDAPKRTSPSETSSSSGAEL